MRNTDVTAITVLVVEDNPEMRLLLQTLLHAARIPEVWEASTAEEALGMLDRSDRLPDILLVDCQMPGMGGLALTERLRLSEDPRRSTLPVILMTGHGLSDQIRRATEAGANDFLVKPFNAKILLGRLERCLSDCRTLAERAAARLSSAELR